MSLECFKALIMTIEFVGVLALTMGEDRDFLVASFHHADDFIKFVIDATAKFSQLLPDFFADNASDVLFILKGKSHYSD